MRCVFVQFRCTPGKTYEVAEAIYDREVVSELYSTSGEYDLIAKVYIQGYRVWKSMGETRLCCTNPVRDSSCESSVVAGVDEQTKHTDLQDHELARV